MRKSIFARTLALWLCVFTVLLFGPAQEISAEQTATTQEEDYVFNEEFKQTQDLSDLDWRNCSDEAVSHAVLMKDWYEVGAWLDSMGQEELEELLARDTDLLSEAAIRPAELADDNGVVAEEDIVYSTVYEYSLAYYRNKMRMRASYPAKTSGYWTINIKNAGTGQVCTLKIKVEGIDPNIPTDETQKVVLSHVWSGTNWCSASYADSTGYLYKATRATVEMYAVAGANFSYTKPAGYTVSTSYSNCNEGAHYRLYWNPVAWGQNSMLYFNTAEKILSDSSNRRVYTENTSMMSYDASSYTGKLSLMSLVDIFSNAGVGTEHITGRNLVQTITLTPINYTVNYHGNGANGGSVAEQKCAYGKTYTAQNNGFTRSYTVTYDGNGGTCAVESQKADYTFIGWGKNQASSVNYAAGASYNNLTTTQNAAVTMYALWNPASVKLADASRTGYQFEGWNIGNAGAEYTPTANVTATASWTANTYYVCLDANGGVFETDMDHMENDDDEALETVAATYDTEIRLPRPVRAGYIFEGWTGADGTYVDAAENLTKENHATVNLTANWTACKETPYTIYRYYQKVRGSKEYEMFHAGDGFALQGTEVRHGTTDSTIMVPAEAVKGYVAPEAQQITIAGDGSTVIYFYYKLEEEKDMQVAETVVKGVVSGAVYKVNVNGVEYRVVQNADGTLGIKDVAAGASKVTVPETVIIDGKSYRITEICDKAFYQNEKIKEVKLSANVGKIGKSAFEGCRRLEKVTIRKGLVNIGDRAFKGCTALKKIKLPETARVIGDSAFYGCGRLNTVTLNKGLLKIGSKAFYGCKSLKKVKIPKTVLKMGSYAFKKCSKLKNVTFAGGAQLLDMGKGIFSYCKALTKITLPSKLTSVPSKAFYGCKKMKTVTIKTKSLHRVGAKAFKKCSCGIRFVVPAKKAASYKKLLKGKY
nr:leucine-rich repeat protein [Lachnospiraceae bacterium]